jgi:hypothetical protein
MSVNDYYDHPRHDTLNDIHFNDFSFAQMDVRYGLNFDKLYTIYHAKYPNLTNDALLYRMFLDKYFGYYLGYYRGKLN